MWTLDEVQGHHAPQPQRAPQRDVARGAREAHGRTTRRAAPPGARLPRAPRPERPPGGAGGARRAARRPSRDRHGQDAHRPLRARRHRDRGRRGRDDPQRRLPPGHHAHARLQGGAVLGVQVVPARRRGRPRPLLDVRAARLRGGGGLDAAVPRPRLLRPRGRAHQLRRGDHSTAARRRGRSPRSVEAVEPLTSDIRLCAEARRPDEPLEFKPGQYVDITIPGHEDEHRSFSMAEHGRRGRARVHDQALPGRPVLGPARRRRDQAGRRARGDRPLRGLHAAPQLAAAAAVHRRRRRHGADPLAAALDAGDGRRARGGLLLRRPHRGRPLPPGGARPTLPVRVRPRALGGQQRLGRARPG